MVALWRANGSFTAMCSAAGYFLMMMGLLLEPECVDVTEEDDISGRFLGRLPP
jgi:hypothetical protein